MRRLVVVSVTVVLLAAACGGDDLSGGDQAISDAIFDQMMADTDPDNPFGETESRCFADGVVRDIGVADLAELGMTAESIEAGTEPAAQAEKFFNLVTDCLSFEELTELGS